MTKWTYLLENNFALDDKDINWLKFKILQTKCLMNPSVYKIIKSLYYYFIGRYTGVKFKNNFFPLFKMFINGK